MTREERLHTKVSALENLLQQDLIPSDRLHYKQRLVQVKSQLEALQSPVTQPVKTSTELLEEYNLGLDSCRWTEREIQKSGVPPESVVMLGVILQDMQPYLEKLKHTFLSLSDANVWLPETRADKYQIRDQLFELDMEKESLVNLLELQSLQFERHGNTDLLMQNLKQNQAELEKLKLKIETLQNKLNS